MNFRHFLQMLEFNLWHFWKMSEIRYIKIFQSLEMEHTPPVLPSVTKFIYFQIRISWTWGVPEIEKGPLEVFCREKYYYPTC